MSSDKGMLVECNKMNPKVSWTNDLIQFDSSTYELEETNEPEDLELGNVRDGIPGLGRGEAGREGITLKGHGPGPGDAVGVDDVADESEHGNAAVLDLGLTEETDGGLVTRAPEVGIGKAKGIVEANGRVEVLGQRLEVSLFIHSSKIMLGWLGKKNNGEGE